MKKILGLDLGTNSIGWAVIEVDHDKRIVRIIALGSRILPMDAGEISKFENGGKLKSSASERTDSKSIRKNKARYLLRRDRLHCVLNILEMLPEHYKLDIEFINDKGKRSGKIKKGREPKLAYYADENGKSHFLFNDAYQEMENEFKSVHPELLFRGKKQKKLPYDWTLYYLRKKALTQELTKEELAWVTMSFLPKRGYEKIMGQDEKEQKEGELSEIINARVISVEDLNKKSTDGLNTYLIKLADDFGNTVFEYIEEASYQITQVDELKQFEKISKFDKDNDEKIKGVEIIISEIKSIKVTDVLNTHEKRKEQTVFKIQLESGWTYDYSSKNTPRVKDTNKDFIISCSYDEKGTLKKRSIKMPSDDDWQLEKLKTETSIQNYNSRNKTVGVASYIYDTLLHNPTRKIKAGLVTTIERRYYEEELRAILDTQKAFHPELKDERKYKDALTLLYPNNEIHRNTLSKQGFSSLLGDDIIFYQRDLKPKKSLIANCKYESASYIKDGVKTNVPLKCIARSNPFFQEFRLWQFIKRLRIIQLETVNAQGVKLVNQEVTEKYLTPQVRESLFAFLNNKKEVTQSAILRFLKLKGEEYKWNFEEDHKEPCNETRYDFMLRLKRIKDFDWEGFLNAKAKIHAFKKKDPAVIIDGCTNEYLLWHFFYSVKKKEERIKGLPRLIEKLLKNAGMNLSYKDRVVEVLSSITTYKNEYGTYSEKAIKKLLPFMRLGKYWNKKDVERIKTASFIKPEVLIKENINGEITDLQGLWVSSACYIVYGRYSEVGDAKRWTQPEHINNYLEKEFRHNALNNPVVEKVVREALLVVRDIWTTYGETEGCYINDKGEEAKAYKKYFDQINIEIGTSLKSNNKKKENDSKRNRENRLANERAIAILKELKSVYTHSHIEENSPFQQERIKILESGIIESIAYDKDSKQYDYNVPSNKEKFTKKEIKDLLKTEISKISANDIVRYRLWLEQRYLSPYTGKPISLSNLFDRSKYQIDHIFPQERITFNALVNKVICEAEINQAKGAMTGYEFILHCNNNNKGKVRYNGKEIVVLSPEEYVDNVNSFITNSEKKEILLSKDIPSRFGNNQLNNSRYIAKLAMGLLSNIVREDDENEYKSKNVLVLSGGVTSRLKKDWQLDETWNELIKPRFISMNDLLSTNDFGEVRQIEGHNVFVPSIPNKEISKKRIDHRHHALDALIVALTTRNQINYINNESALDINTDRKNERRDLKAKYMGKRHGDKSESFYFLPPMQYKINGDVVKYQYAYKGFTPQFVLKNVALEALQHTLVTFKQKNRIMRQRINWIQHPDYKDGLSEKGTNLKKNYSIRQSLHKATFYGVRNFMPVAIEDAIKKPEKIVENRIKMLIQQYTNEGKTKDDIIAELKKDYPVVYVHEKCATTQWSHSIDYLANIKEKEDGKDKKKEKSGKSAIIREIECIADISVQNILKKHLARYDSIKLPISEAAAYYDDIIDEKQKEQVDSYRQKGENANALIDVFVRDKEIGDKQIRQNPQIAFSTDGIITMNESITSLNNGKKHKPIYKVQVIQAIGKMFPVAELEMNKPVTVKNKQYVISDSGSNNFCGIYKSANGETKIYVPSLRTTIEATRNGEELFPRTHPDDVQFKYVFTLSPLDLVYIPTEDEIINHYISDDIDYSRIFVVNDFNDAGKVYFRPYNHANAITEKEVDLRRDQEGRIIGSFSDKTANYKGCSIRDCCVPVKTDRLGNIMRIGDKIIDDSRL